ncbi:MAG: hypothetical protein ACPG4T_06680 [Nannocystaceae bacterium]
MPPLQKNIVLFGAWFLLGGCFDSQALVDRITAYNDGLESSSTDSTKPWLPTPTSGTSTGTGTHTTVEETSSPIDDFPTEELVDVTIAVSHTQITQARSVVVTTTSVGSDVVELIVRQEGQDDVHIELPPFGEHELEYQVVKPGDVEFEILAQGYGGHRSEVAHLAVYMPAPGSVEQVIGEQGKGAAIVLRPKTGALFDRPFVVGNNADGEVVFLGEPSPYDVVTEPMEVTSAAVNDHGDVFVGGLAGEDGVVRKYSNRNLMWSYPVHSAVVHDLAVTPDGVMAVGATVENGVTNAAYWSLTESGGLLDHQVWTAQTEQNEPLNSSIHSVVIDVEQILMAGSSEVQIHNNKIRQRAAVFTRNPWAPCFSHVHEDDDVTSAWLGLTEAQDGFVAVGFERIGQNPPKVARAAFNWDCALQDFWVNTGPSGRGVAAGPSTLAGSTILNDDDEHVFVSSSSPSWEFTGGLGGATGLVVDRHGYVHVSGTIVFEGSERMSLLSFHP